jgi:hypothetical protein
MYRPNIAILREFSGPKGKRYVLLKSSNLHQGAYIEAYELLYLVAPSGGQSFALTPLADSLSSDSGDCGEYTFTRDDGVVEKAQEMTEGVATDITAVHVQGEGTASIRIVFDIKEQDCITLKTRSYRRVFGLRRGKFAEIPHAASEQPISTKQK